MKSITDDNMLCESIRKGGRNRNEALRKLYSDDRIRNSILKIVRNSGGNKVDAVDVLQEAIILFDRNIREDKYDFKSQVTTYIIGLGKYIWFNQMRKNAKTNYTEDVHTLDGVEDYNPELGYIEEETRAKITRLLKKSGKLCFRLLKMWKESIPLKEIAGKLNFPSYNAARKKKYRCLKKLTGLLQENAHLQEYFKN